jgi:hypothetical protein
VGHPQRKNCSKKNTEKEFGDGQLIKNTMARENIYDNRSSLRGSLVTESNGDARLYDSNSRLVGVWRDRDGKAYDANSRLVGSSIGMLYSLLD